MSLLIILDLAIITFQSVKKTHEMNQENILARKKKSFLKKILPYLIVIIAVANILFLMDLFKPMPQKATAKPSGVVVETDTAEIINHTMMVESQGVITAQRQIALIPEIQGKIIKLSEQFAAGGRFQKNDILVTIDPADYEVAVERARAALAVQQAQLETEQARSEQALKDWQSFGKKRKPSDLVLNIPQLKGAKASVEAARADLRKAQRDLSKTQIRAPFDGVVIRKTADIGQFVSIGSQLGQIAGSAIAEVRLPLTDQQIEKIEWPSAGQWSISVNFVNDDEHPIAQGKIVRLEAVKDEKTLVNYAVAQIDKPFDKALSINDFVNARITGKTLNNVLKVPIKYVMPNERIGVYQKDNTLSIKKYQSSYQDDDYVYISTGINASDDIVVTPIQDAYNGMLLRMQQPLSGQ